MFFLFPCACTAVSLIRKLVHVKLKMWSTYLFILLVGQPSIRNRQTAFTPTNSPWLTVLTVKTSTFLLASPAFLHSSHLHCTGWHLADISIVLLTWKFNFCTQLFWNWENSKRNFILLALSASHSMKAAIILLERQNTLSLNTKISHRLSQEFNKTKECYNYLLSSALQLDGAELVITYHLITVWW